MAFEEQHETFTAVGGKAVTPGSALLEPMARALWVGGAGDVAVEGPDGSIVTYVNVNAGTILPVQAVRVLGTTTATAIVAMH